jgi:hypothetical protein
MDVCTVEVDATGRQCGLLAHGQCGLCGRLACAAHLPTRLRPPATLLSREKAAYLDGAGAPGAICEPCRHQLGLTAIAGLPDLPADPVERYKALVAMGTPSGELDTLMHPVGGVGTARQRMISQRIDELLARRSAETFEDLQTGRRGVIVGTWRQSRSVHIRSEFAGAGEYQNVEYGPEMPVVLTADRQLCRVLVTTGFRRRRHYEWMPLPADQILRY